MTRLPREPGSGSKPALSVGAPELRTGPSSGTSQACSQAAPGRREPPPKHVGLLLGTKAIADFLGVSKGHARSLIERRAIPTFKLDGTSCAIRASVFDHLKALEAQHGERS